VTGILLIMQNVPEVKTPPDASDTEYTHENPAEALRVPLSSVLWGVWGLQTIISHLIIKDDFYTIDTSNSKPLGHTINSKNNFQEILFNNTKT